MSKLTLKNNETWIVKDVYKKVDMKSLPNMCANCKMFDIGATSFGKCGSKHMDNSFRWFEWCGVCEHHERDDFC